ncbi:MAG: glutamine synthetase family protein [Pseudomonadota bacterium]
MNAPADPSQWFDKHETKYLELIVSDMAGIARGKAQPAADFAKKFKLPWSIFGQTITADYYLEDNVQDKDMEIRPDWTTLRPVPWATEPTACVLSDCFELDGEPMTRSPRVVLQRVLGLYAAQGWYPIVAPEVEFYLIKDTEAGDSDADVYDPESDAAQEGLIDPYGFDYVHDLGDFFQQLSQFCEQQDIAVGAVSQELGPSQFEVNFNHGEPMKLADDLFHFKRTLKRVAFANNLHATFIAKPDPEIPGSALHVHQSIYDADGNNVFSKPDGEPSELFSYFLGGLQTYMKSALLMFAPYANSYRRFLSHWSSPINLEWGVDNRTAGLRVPESDPQQRRVENRIAGSDVNPYLALAATLACGYLGMIKKIDARPEIEGSAYKVPFALLRHQYEAIDALRASNELGEVFSEDFVHAYTAVKELEYREFQARVPEWEREELMHTL